MKNHLRHNLVGKKFGKLSVISRLQDSISPNGTHHVTWLCKCDCGNETTSQTQQLLGGHKISCGCMSSRKTIGDRTRKHGLFGNPLYGIWGGIVQRCENKHNTSYARYGGKGITICSTWRNNPQAFYDWAMMNGYQKGMELDRIDPEKGYSPENCRWITRFENTARAQRVPWPKMEEGCKMLLEGIPAKEIANRLGVHFATVYRWKSLLSG